MTTCRYCGSTDWQESSPSYSFAPRQLAHYCPRTWRRETMNDEADTHYRGQERTEEMIDAFYAEARKPHD